MTADALVDLALIGAPENPIVRPSSVVAIVANDMCGTVVLHLRMHEHNAVLVVKPDDEMVVRVPDLRRRATELRGMVLRMFTAVPPLDEAAVRADERRQVEQRAAAWADRRAAELVAIAERARSAGRDKVAACRQTDAETLYAMAQRLRESDYEIDAPDRVGRVHPETNRADDPLA